MAKVKLTIDARLIINSGIGVYVQNIISNSLLSQFDVELLYSFEHADLFNDLSPSIRLTTYNASLYSIKELIETPAKTIGTDIFWSPHYNVPLVNFASRLKVVTIHDVYHLAYYSTLNIKQRIYAKLMMNRAVNSSDIIFTVSEFSKNEIIKYTSCNPNKIRVVYNGINFEKYATLLSADEEQRILLKYKLPDYYILFVGNIKPHKNLKQALLGYRRYIESSGDARIKFVIVGKQEGFITGDDELQKVILDPFFKSNVFFTGWAEDADLPVLYQKAKVFIFPSLYEGFGFPPLEAMAAGCPVASSNAACLPEIYGNAAFYFDPLDIESIAKAIGEMLSDTQLRSKLIEEGIAQSKKYTWDNAVKKKIEIIRESLDNKKRN